MPDTKTYTHTCSISFTLTSNDEWGDDITDSQSREAVNGILKRSAREKDLRASVTVETAGVIEADGRKEHVPASTPASATFHPHPTLPGVYVSACGTVVLHTMAPTEKARAAQRNERDRT